ncbi:uncharacterized protein LOC141904074 [Tubulanus polymorphus]|uniref:uncharacterized protein LOC141904074 n=1 Tax=Tubulanus polymorphus TaxID=672921 RepID=UPI003DA6B34A
MFWKIVLAFLVLLIGVLLQLEFKGPTVITSQKVLLSRPLNSVFDFVSNLEQIDQWYPILHNLKAIDPKSQNHVGKLYREPGSNSFPFFGTGSVEVVACNPPNFFSFTVDSMFLPLYELSLEADSSMEHTDTMLTVKLLSRRQSYAFRYIICPVVQLYSTLQLQQSLFMLKMLFRE